MAMLRIYDLTNYVLALDLRDLIRVLGLRSSQATWTISAVIPTFINQNPLAHILRPLDTIFHG